MQVLVNPKTVVKIQPQEHQIFDSSFSDLIDDTGLVIGRIGMEMQPRLDALKIQVKCISTQQSSVVGVKASDGNEIVLRRAIDAALAKINFVADWKQINGVGINLIADDNNNLLKALEDAATRIDFLTNWIENTYGGSNKDVELGRSYAKAARAVIAKENNE